MIRSMIKIAIAAQTTILFAATHKVPWELIQKMLPNNPVVVEAGAQFGEDTQIMADMWPNSTQYAFEPMPESYKKLSAVANNYPHVHVSTYALTNKRGQANFWVCGGASSLLKPVTHINNQYFHSDLEHPITVECITLDEWCIENDVKHVDFLWFDMEGNELNALHGAVNTLKNVQLIFIEVSLQKFWHGGAKYQELVQWLENLGFKKVWSDIVPHWNGNLLFAR